MYLWRLCMGTYIIYKHYAVYIAWYGCMYTKFETIAFLHSALVIIIVSTLAMSILSCSGLEQSFILRMQYQILAAAEAIILHCECAESHKYIYVW